MSCATTASISRSVRGNASLIDRPLRMACGRVHFEGGVMNSFGGELGIAWMDWFLDDGRVTRRNLDDLNNFKA